MTAAASKLYEKMENIKKCVFYMSYQKPMGNCGSKDIIPVLLIVLFGGCLKKKKHKKNCLFMHLKIWTLEIRLIKNVS